jgi:PilZ domain
MLRQERKERRTPRYTFFASAQVTEIETQTAMAARTSEISQHGCYLDMSNPLPLGKLVRIEIVHQEQTLDVGGRVIYSQRNMGMGVAFQEITAEDQKILDKWLAQMQ